MAKRITNQEGHPVALLVKQTRDGNYFHITATVVTVTEKNELRNPSASYGQSDLIGGLDLADLQVSSQGNNDDAERHLYGWETRYRDVYSIDRVRAKYMAKTLQTIETRLERDYERFGRPLSFGQYISRIARAIGATQIVFTQKENGSSYRYNEYLFRSIADGIAHVDGLDRAWRDERQQEHVA